MFLIFDYKIFQINVPMKPNPSELPANDTTTTSTDLSEGEMQVFYIFNILKILRKLWPFLLLIQDDDDGVEESSGEEEEKCPEGFEYNSVLNVCDDVDEVI